MELVCHHCGKKFKGNKEKFCHDDCRDSYIIEIGKKVEEAVEKDTSHTRELSKDF